MKSKFFLGVFTLVLVGAVRPVLAQDTQPLPPDAVIRQKIVGLWTLDEMTRHGKVHTMGTISFNTNGWFSEKFAISPANDSSGQNTDTLTDTGTWRLSNGVLVKTFYTIRSVHRFKGVARDDWSQGRPPDGRVAKPVITQHQILSMTADEMTTKYLDEVSHWKRQR